jgi:hypothetical protein
MVNSYRTTALEEEYKGKFGPSQSSELQISEKSTDQADQAIQGQQLATQVVEKKTMSPVSVAKSILRTALKRLRTMPMEG